MQTQERWGPGAFLWQPRDFRVCASSLTQVQGSPASLTRSMIRQRCSKLHLFLQLNCVPSTLGILCNYNEDLLKICKCMIQCFKYKVAIKQINTHKRFRKRLAAFQQDLGSPGTAPRLWRTEFSLKVDSCSWGRQAWKSLAQTWWADSSQGATRMDACAWCWARVREPRGRCSPGEDTLG